VAVLTKSRIAKLALLVLGLTGARASTETPLEYQVKAAFLFNFAKFVEWPAQSFKGPQDPISICILGKNPFGDALAGAVHGKTVDGRALAIRQVDDAKEACDCNILFVRSSERKRSRPVLDAIAGRGVLTVGETDTFTSDGGIINFKIDGARIRFQINIGAAERERLRISSKLLGLAEIVGGQ
jgi:hypothetical protein